MINATRATARRDKSVHWQNMIGGMLGQKGTYEFATEEQAILFVEYAEEEFGAIDPDTLAKRGLEVIEER